MVIEIKTFIYDMALSNPIWIALLTLVFLKVSVAAGHKNKPLYKYVPGDFD